jgi:aerobic C4-dicarboxylate transport protein
MKLIRDIFHHPAALLAAVLLGAWTGVLWPAGSGLFAALSTIYLSLIQALGLPFLVLAVYSGLQHMPASVLMWRRVLACVALGLLAMLLCALCGALLASVSAAGAGMDSAQEASLGRLALSSEAPLAISLHREEDAPTTASAPAGLVPSNLYAVIAFGSAPSVLIGVLLFGAAVAVQGQQENHLSGILEAAYRGLEVAIRSVNAGLPLTAFVLAAAAAGTAGDRSIGLLAGFMATWSGAMLLVCGLAFGTVCWRLKAHPWQVAIVLREPITICLFAPVGTAALPGFIDALCLRLGFSRGVVELLAAANPVFIRAGEAMFFAVLAVFAANLYGRPLPLTDIVAICLLSCWTSLCSIGMAGVKATVWSGVLQASFGLPMEAMLPVLVAVEVLCEGPRNLVSYLLAAALIALASDRVQWRAAGTTAPAAPEVALVLNRRQAWLSLMLLGLALCSVFCAGFGFGLRKIVLTAL